MTSGVSDALRSSSQSLDLSTRTFMESRFGRDFGNVRIHTGPIAAAASRAMNADAFTIDRDIVFAEGAYSPASATGRRLIAHELTHVEQQRVGASGVSGGTHTEREARDVSTAVAHGGRATVRHGAPTMAQRQEAEGSGSTGAAASSPDFQLHLDPEIEVQMARMFVRWWLGTTLVAGDAPTTISGWSAGGLTPFPITGGVPGSPLSPTASQGPNIFAPIPPDPYWVPPDYGSLYGAYNERNVPLQGRGDNDVVMGLYRDRLRLVQQLPDLRSLAPGFIRPLIPTTWRRDVAGALTSATIGSSIGHDYMTPIEISDRAWENMTGASTTMIPLPGISFNLF